MGFKRIVTTIDAHVEGGPARVITGGVPNIPGDSMAEKLIFMEKNLDYLRTATVNEPRGHRDMNCAVLTSPTTNEAEFGVIFMTPRHYMGMCGHASIGVAGIAVETGIVEPKEPVTEFKIDTPSGLIRARVTVSDGKAKSATIQNVPSFLLKSTVLEVPGIGELPVDVAYGGNFYVIVEAEHLDFPIDASNIKRMEDQLAEIVKATNEQVEILHPEADNFAGANAVKAVAISDKPKNPNANRRNIVVAVNRTATIGSRQTHQHIDRTPCGTGTCAKMATLYSKGKLEIGESFVTESILGSLFEGKLVGSVTVGGAKAVVPEITGRVYITGMHTFIMDEDDPFKHGFIL
ncbi:MAG: proline racemase family protein [Thermodesulfobacteriota bacterium]